MHTFGNRYRFAARCCLRRMGEETLWKNPGDETAPARWSYLIQVLFKEPVPIPEKEKMAEFQDGKCPVQLMADVNSRQIERSKGQSAFLAYGRWLG